MRSWIIVGLLIAMLSVGMLLPGCGPEPKDPTPRTGTLPPTVPWPVEPEQTP